MVMFSQEATRDFPMTRGPDYVIWAKRRWSPAARGLHGSAFSA